MHSVVEAQVAGCAHVGRVQGEGALVLGDRFRVARLEPKDGAPNLVRPSQIRIEGERLQLQFVGPLEVAFRVAGTAKRRLEEELEPQ